MQHVDALSRLNTIVKKQFTEEELVNKKEDKLCKENYVNKTVNILNDCDIEQNIIVAQEQDVKLLNIKELLERSTFPDFELINGVLFRKEGQKRLLVVPKLMIDTVIKLCHDNCGHIGIEKTLYEIRQQFWFSRMKKMVKNYINNCLTCIFYSPAGRK